MAPGKSRCLLHNLAHANWYGLFLSLCKLEVKPMGQEECEIENCIQEKNTRKGAANMKRSRRILSLVLALIMICSAMGVMAFAAEPDVSERTLLLEVCEDNVVVADTGIIASLARTLSATKNTISFPIAERKIDVSTMSVVDISAMDQLINENQKVQAADLLFAEVGFTDEEIQLIKDEQKLKTLTGDEWGITRSSGQSYDSDLESYSNWSSSLSYTRQSINEYLFSNFSFDMLPVDKWAQTICVEGFSLDYNTAILEYQCIPIVNGVEQWPIRGVYTWEDTSNDDFNFEFENLNGAYGCAFSYQFDPFSFSDADAVYYYMEVAGEVSNLNLPVNGQPGGAFNVYGNLVRFHRHSLDFSFSYPWGITVDHGGWVISECHTYLHSALYAD